MTPPADKQSLVPASAGGQPDCKSCPFYQQGNQFCPHERPAAAPLFIIQGESPGAKEIAAGRPFVGPSGILLDNELRKVGVNRAQGLACNTVACRPPKMITDAMWRKAIQCCAPYLDSTLAGFRSLPCLALGDWSAWNRTGNSSITKWYGYPLPQKESTVLTVMPCIHPAFVLREPAWLEEFAETLRRFSLMVKGTFTEWKEPDLEYSEDTGRILTVLRQLRTTGSLGCDTETAGTDGLFVRLLCMSLSDGDRSVCFDWPPAPEVLAEVRRRLTGEQRIVFHNRQHDTLVLAKAGIEMPNVQCTLNKHAALYPGLYHGLSVAAVACEPAPRWKSEFHDEGSDHKGADVFTSADPVKRRRYCALDSYFGQRVDRRLSELLGQDVVSREVYRELEEQAEIALHMRRVGIKYNEAFRDARLAVYDKRAARVAAVFAALSAKGAISGVDLGKGGTTGAVARLLLDELRLQPLEFTDSGKPGTGAWSLQMWGTGQGGASELAQHVCRLLLRFRRAAHAADMIRSLTPSPDMRIHAPWNPWGALTGRWSCSKPNLMNLPKRGYYGMRQLLMADEGCCFVAADADKAEIRAVAYDANDEPLLKAFEAGVDVHLANAVDLFGDKLLTQSKAEQEGCRDLAKRLCVPMDTQTLCRTKGWVGYAQLDVGDEILTYNKEKNCKEWAPVLEKFFWKNQPIIEMAHGQGFKIRSTPEHGWFVRQRHKSHSSWTKPYMTHERRTTAELNQESNIITNAPMTQDVAGVAIPFLQAKYGVNWAQNICAASSAERRAFLQGFLIADGHCEHRHSVDVWAWSQLKNELNEGVLAAAFIEHAGNVYMTEQVQPNGKTICKGRLSLRRHVTMQEMTKTLLPAQDVWCVKTKNDSWVIRQGNTVTITGNCYGFNYGAKPETVHHALAPSHPELQLKHIVYLQARWFQKHPAIKNYQYRLVEKARKEMVIKAPIGYRREFFPQGLVDPNKIYNFPAQSMIAEVIRRAQVALFPTWDIRINCHDEIVLNVPVGRRLEAQAALEAAMTAPFELHGVERRIPVETKMGYTWGELMAPEKFEALLKKESEDA